MKNLESDNIIFQTETETETPILSKPTINHLVIPGGGVAGVTFY